MNFIQIKGVLNANRDSILSEQSFEDRMRKVYEILDNAFPSTSLSSAIYGPITSLGDFISRGEIEIILNTVKKSSEIGLEFISLDQEINQILEYIYIHFGKR